jgi:hypothetical protein
MAELRPAGRAGTVDPHDVSVMAASTATAQFDDRVSRLGLERNAARRVFSVAMRPDSPVEVYLVEEVR